MPINVHDETTVFLLTTTVKSNQLIATPTHRQQTELILNAL